MESSDYGCLHCGQKLSSIRNIVSHSETQHPNKHIAYRVWVLSDRTGNLVPRITNLNVIPTEVYKESGKLFVRDDGTVSIKRRRTSNAGKNEGDPTKKVKTDNSEYVFKEHDQGTNDTEPIIDAHESVLSNTTEDEPTKKVINDQSDRSEGFLNEEDPGTDTILPTANYEDMHSPACHCSSEDIDVARNEDTLLKALEDQMDILRECLPETVRTLAKHGLLELWISFHQLLTKGIFPLKNLSFLLFMDVVRFYTCSTTTQMRYSEDIKTFWRTGYSLFGGKFLRFMGGPKSEGEILVEGHSSRGQYSPQNSRINFVVPCSKHLSRNTKKDETLKPGLIADSLDIMASESRQVKICFDGKKLNSCLSANHGDVDLFGCEEDTTCAERKDKLDNEIQLLEKMAERAESGEVTPSDLISAVKVISMRIVDLRKMAAIKSEVVKKFMALGQPDWHVSKYAFVVSSLQSSLFQIKETIQSSLQTNDRLGRICAELQGSGHLYCCGSRLHLQNQGNYICMTECSESSYDRVEESSDIERCLVKQRSSAWFKIRNEAKVTGSTAHQALGLETLKKQCQHFDKLNGINTASDVSATTAMYLKHGTDNELNAVATLVGKVLPVFYPHVSFVEEGCITLKSNGYDFMVISPDGSGRTYIDSKPTLAFEFKCPYDNKRYVPQVHYSIPFRYLVQLLAEMAALSCSEMIFLSYTEFSSTIFRVQFSEEVWHLIWQELQYLYGGESLKKPGKIRLQSKQLKEALQTFGGTHIHFLGEVPSVKAVPCAHPISDTKPHLNNHTNDAHPEVSATDGADDSPSQSLFKAKQCVKEAFHLCRKRATELFIFMISDLNRISSFGCGHAMPVAYGLQGSSLKSSTVQKMLKIVLEAADGKGLEPLVFSCDGQWISLVTRDPEGRPLTQLQFQKLYWDTVKKMTKPELITFFKKLNGQDNRNIVWSKLTVHPRHMKLLKCHKRDEEKSPNQREETEETIENILPADLEEKLDANTYTEIVKIVQSLVDDSKRIQEMNSQPQVESDANTPSSCQPSTISIETRHVETMLTALRSQTNTRNADKWKLVDVEHFTKSLSPAEGQTSIFSKPELKICVKLLKQFFPKETKHMLLSSPKEEMLCGLAKVFNIDYSAKKCRPKKRHCLMLKELALKKVQTLPKVFLGAVYAELTYPEKEKTWRQSFPYSSDTILKTSTGDCAEVVTWYSYPGTRTLDCGRHLPLLGVIDSHHILCNLRTKCCSTGIRDRNINREAWVNVAQKVRSNQTGLTLAHVDDVIDKQNNGYARLTFSQEVESEMMLNGHLHEAEFCRIVRDWYSADDDAGIDCQTRLNSRLKMRSWLLDKYHPYEFPPPTSYVGGIPTVTFESLLTNCERKIQLYSFVETQSYNPRSVSSLDAETFFSCLTDMSSNALRPAEIPRALTTATDIAKLYADPNRPFHLHTSRAPVYPKIELLEPLHEGDPVPATTSFNDMAVIYLRDHTFDKHTRTRTKPRRKRVFVSGPDQPGKGARGIREFHRVDETKIMPHKRLGIVVE